MIEIRFAVIVAQQPFIDRMAVGHWLYGHRTYIDHTKIKIHITCKNGRAQQNTQAQQSICHNYRKILCQTWIQHPVTLQVR